MRCGALSGYLEVITAARSEKHSVHRDKSVMRPPRLGRAMRQQVLEPSSLRQDSGRSSLISMYSPWRIFVTSFGGMRLTPGIDGFKGVVPGRVDGGGGGGGGMGSAEAPEEDPAVVVVNVGMKDGTPGPRW